MSGLLDGKRLLVTGVVSTDSIAWHVARSAQELGGEVALSALARDHERAVEAAASLPTKPEVRVADWTDPQEVADLVDWLRQRWGGLDGALHAIAFAPRGALDGDFLACPSDDAARAFTTSTHSYAVLGQALRTLAGEGGGSLVGLDFDASRAWPTYNWMGVCKAALEATNRYVARDLGAVGIRSNLVAAGPLRTRAASAIAGFDLLEQSWEANAPLPWPVDDPAPVADAVCFLLSDLARGITGEVLHVDGGHHAVAAPLAR